MLLTDIPGLSEAVAVARGREQTIRDFAFTNLLTEICGVPVRQLTARHYHLLCACDSPFLAENHPATAAEVAQFIWIVSPEFTIDAATRTAFITALQDRYQLECFAAYAAITQYVAEAMMDRPPRSTGGSGAIYTAAVAGIIDFACARYGWDDEVALDKPLARLFQYARQADLVEGRGAHVENALTLKARGEAVRAHLEGQPK